jgi:Tol biopolymer transport system component
MMNEQEIREMLKHRADAISATPSHIRPAVRAARRRLVLTVGLALVSIGVLAAGAVVGATRLTTASPAVPASQPPASEPPPVTQETSSGTSFFLDLRTGETTPLPRAILRSLGPDVGGGVWASSGQFAASPDGSQLAYVGTIGGRPQIFIAGIDGTGVRQITDETTGAIRPAWSPDGTSIAFQEGTTSNIFVLDLDTGQITRVADESPIGHDGLQFTPDGSSILFTGGSNALELRTVPVNGGRSTLLFDPEARGFGDTAGGSLSPDGSLVTFMGDRIGEGGALRFVTNADGTDWRHIGSCISNPAGTWSPDGSRIVCGPNGPPPGIRIIDIATGDTTTVAKGRVAIWVDDDTLLVEAR